MTAVLIRAKSPWQKPDCLFCENDSTLEATASRGGFWAAHIRCCTQPECLEKARSCCETFVARAEACLDGAN